MIQRHLLVPLAAFASLLLLADAHGHQDHTELRSEVQVVVERYIDTTRAIALELSELKEELQPAALFAIASAAKNIKGFDDGQAFVDHEAAIQQSLAMYWSYLQAKTTDPTVTGVFSINCSIEEFSSPDGQE